MLYFFQERTPKGFSICRIVDNASVLRIPLTKAIQSGHKNILILSDGYENQSTGAVDAILNLPVVREI